MSFQSIVFVKFVSPTYTLFFEQTFITRISSVTLGLSTSCSHSLLSDTSSSSPPPPYILNSNRLLITTDVFETKTGQLLLHFTALGNSRHTFWICLWLRRQSDRNDVFGAAGTFSERAQAETRSHIRHPCIIVSFNRVRVTVPTKLQSR